MANLFLRILKSIRERGLITTVRKIVKKLEKPLLPFVFPSNLKGVMNFYFNPNVLKKSKLSEPNYEQIRKDFIIKGLEVVSYKIDIIRFRDWLQRADFSEKYKLSCDSVFIENALEHYIGADLLEMNQNDVFIDVAAEGSPYFDIAERLYGCTAYRLDYTFPPGINGKTIGADATKTPLPDGFATKLALHCAFEMFENDSDVRLIAEAQRILAGGGKMVILPLYMNDFYLVYSHPFTDRRGLNYQSARLVWRDDRYKIRFSRNYSVDAFMERIVNNLNRMQLKIYYVENEKEVDPICYCKFVALFEKIN